MDDKQNQSAEDHLELHRQQREADGEACLEAAIYYLSLGWSALALCPPDHASVGKQHLKTCKGANGKRPLGFWKEYMDTLPTEGELRADWERVPGSNVGMALGPVSGLIRVDVEGEAGEKALQERSGGDLPITLEFKSGRADGTGRGFLYKIPLGAKLRTTSDDYGTKAELRFQARGAQTVLPPSRHKDGNLYAWVPGHSPGVIEAALAPAWVVAELTLKEDGGKRNRSGLNLEDILGGVEEGHRNESAASFIGRLLLVIGDIGNTTAVKLAWNHSQFWNDQNNPPLPEDELLAVFHSILRMERDRRDRLDQEGLDKYVKEEVETSLKNDRMPSTNGHVNHESNGVAKEEPPAKETGWKLIIIESDPKEFRLRAPHWSDSPRLRNGYVILNERQIRCWNSSPEGIPQAVYSQSLVTTDPVYKGWSKPGGPLDMLTKNATVIDVAPENKKQLYMLGFFYRYVVTARPIKREDGTLDQYPPSGRPTIREDGSIVFKLENLKKSIGYSKEEFGVRTITKLLEERGVIQGNINNSRWWIVPVEVLKSIGEITLECGQ